MSTTPTVSVIVCTNRSLDQVRACIASVLAQELAGGTFEVLLVDNTPDGAHADAWRDVPRLRCLREARLGLSRARNAGAAAAAGGVLAYIDDDATAEIGWLAALAEPFADASVACVGGRVKLALPERLPRWYASALDGFWSRFDPPEDDALARTYGDLPVGANLAVRRSVWQELGGFDESLGRRNEGLEGGEDTDFCLRAMRAGYDVRLAARATVIHHIASDRLTVEHLRCTAEAAGASLGRLAPTASLSRRSLLLEAAAQWGRSLWPGPLGAGRRLNYRLRARLYWRATRHYGRGRNRG